MFAARAVEARVALPNLLAGRISADEVQIEAPRLRARFVDGDGRQTGVARPKMLTETFSLLRPSSTSSTVPTKLSNGPSMILTFSPFS